MSFEAPRMSFSKPRSLADRLKASDDDKSHSDSFHYVDLFLRSPRAGELVHHGVFPSTKDLIESMAVLEHFKRAFRSVLRPGIDILVVGDGDTPRTSSLFAVAFPETSVISVDPALNDEWITDHPLPFCNLTLCKEHVENMKLRATEVLIVLVHAHCALHDALSRFRRECIHGIIVTPCCDWYAKQAEAFGLPPTLEKRDSNICSKDNLVRTWSFRTESPDIC